MRGRSRVGEDDETRLPHRLELRVEAVQRLDLEPAGEEHERPRHARSTGPAPIRSPRASAERNIAKFSETRAIPDRVRLRNAATIRNSFRPGSAARSRRIRSSEMPSRPPRHEVEERADLAVLRRGHDHAVTVEGSPQPVRAPSTSRAPSRCHASRPPAAGSARPARPACRAAGTPRPRSPTARSG